MQNKELRETLNIIEVVGTLKENNLEYFTLKDGREALRGNVVVEVKEDDRIHNHRLEVFSMKLTAAGGENGLYKGYETVMNEYKDKLNYGEDADRISVRGSIDINDFTTKTGEFVSNNRLSALFFNRESEETPDRAVGNLELIINSKEMTPCENSSGEPTGDYKFDSYAVGYFNKKQQSNQIIPINDIVVSEKLYQQIKPHYKFGETVKVSVSLNNYAVIQEVETPATTFGEVLDLETTRHYVNEIRMIGGEMPYADEKKFTDEDKVLIEQYRQAVIDDIKGAIPASDFPDTDVMDMDFHDVPDFDL